MKTLPQQLRRIAIAHLGRETVLYLNYLEAVAEAAKRVAANKDFKFLTAIAIRHI